ncbi:cation:proton antiporter [Marispirochaeta aestuarii]|uniref:Cation:proton antiporter n=1 Tax=Marispirochaeta aestuarii TaxID=1963862 RepID=A0A1Y1RU97_9SPIO|nr:monovalent cation/H+ antiporter complex subunit F [Marispirochaeta aestuarii]ORC30292.1 cation:proton antiporter [Marispirochaeta aestuarii]
MADLILFVAGIIVLAALVLAFVRFLAGPDYMNRVVAFDALTIMSLSVIIMLSHYLERTAYLDVALVYALLSFLGVIAVARFSEKEL